MNNRQFTILASVTFLVGMIWLAADIIFNTKASIPISPKLESLLEPVNPNFNPRVLEVIEQEVTETSPAVEAVQIIPTFDNPATESAEAEL